MANASNDDDELSALRRRVAALERELAERNREPAWAEAVLDRAPIAIEVFDAQGFAVWMNRTMVDFLGIPGPEVALDKFNVLTDPMTAASGTRRYFQRAYEGETVTSHEFEVDLGAIRDRWRTGDRKAWFEEVIFPILDPDKRLHAVVAFVHDITERKRMHAALTAAQRHESLALMAGGIAHDFNNLLGGILGHASLGLMEGVSKPEIRECLEYVVRGAERAAGLTRQLLAYTGRGRFVVRTIELAPLVRDMVQLLEVNISKKIELQLEFAPDVPTVRVDETQIRQVLMNLITNASEAIGDASGTISVVASRLEADREQLIRAYAVEHLSPGVYACLEVTDTGCGIAPELMSRLFDPFFTTKPTGHGLGLAAVLGIVQAHGGAIRVSSEPGMGTVFSILLPAAGSEADEPKPVPESASPRPQVGCVLVVDDDDLVRGLAARTLRRGGHEVLEAADGAQGLRCFQQNMDRIDIVLLDLSMPVMDGAEVFHELRLLKPDVRVLLTSGYDEQDTISRFAGEPLAGFIQKPYRASALLERLKELLQAPNSGPVASSE